MKRCYSCGSTTGKIVKGCCLRCTLSFIKKIHYIKIDQPKIFEETSKPKIKTRKKTKRIKINKKKKSKVISRVRRHGKKNKLGGNGASGICKCGEKVENKTKRYCNKCSAEYIRKWRKNHPLNELQKFKDSVRHKTKMRIKRGTLIPYPCEVCGEKKVEAHHDDYNKTYDVRWLCFKHHREHHRNERTNRT